MATRRFIYQTSDGFFDEQDTADDIALGALVVGSGAVGAGNIQMSGVGKVVGLADASAAGEALAYGQAGAHLAGLVIETNDLQMSGQKITGLADAVNATDAVTLQQLDNAVSKTKWRDPVSVLRMIDDLDQGGAPPTSPTAGDAYVVNNWGAGYNDGDIVEYDGSAWNVIVANSGGAPPDGTRVCVDKTNAAGSFATHGNDIGIYDAGTATWSFNTPLEGWAFLVDGDGSVYEDLGYTYDATDDIWRQWTGAGTINAGSGLGKSGNTLFVNFGDGIKNDADYVAVDLDSNGGLALTGATANDKQLSVNLEATDPSLQIVSNELGLKIDSVGGLQKGANGTSIKLNDTPDTLDVDSNGLKVVGLPINFKINDISTGNTVTATNLDTLTDGSNADALHTHAGLGESDRVEADYTAAVNMSKSDPVYFDATSDQVDLADAATDSKAWVIGVAKTDVTAGNTVTIVGSGVAAGVLSSATPGTRYFLNSPSGLIANTPPSGRRRVILVGFAINATDLWVRITDYGKKRV